MANADHTRQDPNDFLMGGGVPSASFLKIGASVTGVISEEPALKQQRDMVTGEPKVWDNGDPMMQLVVTLQTDEHDPKLEDDDGRRRVYIKSHMKKAIADAIRKVKAQGLAVGGRLTVTYTGDGQPTQRGLNPPKYYEAEYVPPTAAYLDTPEPGDDLEPTRSQPVTPARTNPAGALVVNGKYGYTEALAEWMADGHSKEAALDRMKAKMAEQFPGKTGKDLTPEEWRVVGCPIPF